MTASSNEPTLTVKKGRCLALYAYDIGLAVNLEKCREKISGSSGGAGLSIRPDCRAPRLFNGPEPLGVTRALEPVRLGAYVTLPGADILIYDFGAVSVCFTIPVQGRLGDLSALTRELVENARLQEEARRQVELLVDAIRGAVARPLIADLTEDYAILQVEEFESAVSVPDIPARMAGTLAQVLRAEKDELSEQEVADAMACQISYGRDDLAVIDWNAALVIDREGDDIRAVLEAANVELLELRHLDRKLDRSLDESYERVSPQGRPGVRRLGSSRKNMRRISQLQLDGAVLFERVSNAFKLLSDQYLARVYRLASQRFHFGEWNASILRKLEVVEGFYKKLAERSAQRWMEFLEWLIIILFIIDLVIIVWLPGK